MGVFDFRAVPGNRSYWGTFDPIFSDYGYKGLESEIADSAGSKTGLIIPFWLAKLLFYGLDYREMKKGLFRGGGFWDVMTGKHRRGYNKIMEKHPRSLHGSSPGRI